MVDGYSRADASVAGNREPASIIGVDPQTRTATGMLRSRYSVQINCGYAVGDMFIIPAIGEQWYIERFDMEWRLVARIPFNDPTLTIEPEAGQVSIGSASGPLELNGFEIRINGVFRVGTTYFSVNDDGKLQYSPDGETWIPVVPPAGPGAPASTDEVPEGVTNKYFTVSRAADAAPVQTVAGRDGDVVLTKDDVGLDEVDNTPDATKPISSATALALALKADLVTGIVPEEQLPAPRVIQFDEFADFPAPGAANTLYIADDTGNLYRWDGSNYDLLVVGAGTLSNTDELPEGTTNLYYTDERAAAAAPVQDDDLRLSDTRTPTDNTVSTDKIVDEAITLAKLAPDVQDALAASPYDVSYPQTIGVRAVGYGQAIIGVKLQRPVTFTKITYRCGTADASGSSTFEVRKNGATVVGTSLSIIAANQVVGDSITGTFAFAEGDILTVYTSAVGTTPGVGLVADLKGNA